LFFFIIDLILLFKLINRVPNAVYQLKDIVENHIHEMGLEAIERINETALNVNFNLIIILIFNFHLYLESKDLY